MGHSIQPNVYVFKSAYGRYLSADRFGLVSATAEAIGPQQEWVPVLRDDGLALQSKYDKFLAFEDERNSVRADSESAGFREVFAVRCQAARRAERRKQAQSKAAVADKPVNELENESAYVPMRACVCVCVCTRGRERDKERGTERGNACLVPDRHMVALLLCALCLCVCVYACVVPDRQMVIVLLCAHVPVCLCVCVCGLECVFLGCVVDVR